MCSCKAQFPANFGKQQQPSNNGRSHLIVPFLFLTMCHIRKYVYTDCMPHMVYRHDRPYQCEDAKWQGPKMYCPEPYDGYKTKGFFVRGLCHRCRESRSSFKTYTSRKFTPPPSQYDKFSHIESPNRMSGHQEEVANGSHHEKTGPTEKSRYSWSKYGDPEETDSLNRAVAESIANYRARAPAQRDAPYSLIFKEVEPSELPKQNPAEPYVSSNGSYLTKAVSTRESSSYSTDDDVEFIGHPRQTPVQPPAPSTRNGSIRVSGKRPDSHLFRD